MKQVKGFVCDFCKDAKSVKRVYATPGSCARHEKKCYRNPVAKACATCSLWEMVEVGCGTDAEPDATILSRECREQHDRDYFDNGGNGGSLPQSNCEFWQPIIFAASKGVEL